MTEETLEKALELQRNIKSYKKFLKAFNGPFINIIRANEFEGERDTSQIVIISSEPELESMIKKYFVDKIGNLETELEQIN